MLAGSFTGLQVASLGALREKHQSLRSSVIRVKRACTPRTSASASLKRGFVAKDESQGQCKVCLGHTQVVCDACRGEGRLTKGGYHAKNPVFAARIVGAECDKQLDPPKDALVVVGQQKVKHGELA